MNRKSRRAATVKNRGQVNKVTQQSPLPTQLAHGIAAVLNSSFNAGVAQMEIAMGVDKDKVQKVRLIAIRDDLIVSKPKMVDGKEIEHAVVEVPKDLGAPIVEVKK